ncbi:hypothetical protein [Streptomyces sp. S1]|uniref:hypothetical protein n=1 Tax=Streptomyces sp. S1 TaxID=718288 RepID=UPI003D709ED6
MASEQERFSRYEWMGRRVKVTFAPHWPVKIGNYEYQGFDADGIWVSHDEHGQRHILWYDLEDVELVT